jgi:alkanesulfonate monooxygenase SsuD/methylene tetrahydromethanopterin reductase-like flavin-dependent oxidoreductase (luciferase family)
MQDISDGRMVMGIGRGDSSRRVVGLKPVRVADFEQRCAMIKELMNGRTVDWNEKELELKWVREELPDIPMWIAGYGPKALAVAGRVGDGVIIQLADPVIIQWIMDTARRAAEEAGRDPSELKCIVGAPSHISDDIADAREQSRWFPAMVSNHVMDLIERYGDDSEIPKDLTEFVKARKFYDYKDHSRVGLRTAVRHRRDRRPFLRARQRRRCNEEAQGARVDRRRPVQHLPHDPWAGGDAEGVRRRDHPQFSSVAA